MLESRNQWFTQAGFARQEELAFAQCDAHQIARPATLVKACGAIAGQHCDAKGLTHAVLSQQGHVFLLSRLAIHVHTMPKNRQIITLHTWEDGTKGPYFQRVYQWQDQAGTVLVNGRSEWLMVDPVHHKICRPKAESAQFASACPEKIDCPPCQKLPLPKEGMESLGVRRVMWSDLDGNGHLHSGNYGDIIWDYLPSDWQNRPLDTLYLNFNKEARLGQDITLTGQAQGADVFRVEGTADHGSCFSALCQFKTMISPGDGQ